MAAAITAYAIHFIQNSLKIKTTQHSLLHIFFRKKFQVLIFINFCLDVLVSYTLGRGVAPLLYLATESNQHSQHFSIFEVLSPMTFFEQSLTEKVTEMCSIILFLYCVSGLKDILNLFFGLKILEIPRALLSHFWVVLACGHVLSMACM